MSKEIIRTTMPLDKLVIADYNPRRISKSAKKALEESISRWGLVQEIVVNSRNNTVISGAQRVSILREQKVIDAPVALMDLSDAEEKALNIAMNNPFMSGEYDTSKLAEILDEIKIADIEPIDNLRILELVPCQPDWKFDSANLENDASARQDDNNDNEPDTEEQDLCPTCGHKMKSKN